MDRKNLRWEKAQCPRGVCDNHDNDTCVSSQLWVPAICTFFSVTVTMKWDIHEIWPKDKLGNKTWKGRWCSKITVEGNKFSFIIWITRVVKKNKKEGKAVERPTAAQNLLEVYQTRRNIAFIPRTLPGRFCSLDIP